jgi:hypothetical protein
MIAIVSPTGTKGYLIPKATKACIRPPQRLLRNKAL